MMDEKDVMFFENESKLKKKISHSIPNLQI